MDDKIGGLEAGKLADIMVIDTSPFGVDATEIEGIGVFCTMMERHFAQDPDDMKTEAGSRGEFLGAGRHTLPTASYTQPSE